MSEELLQRLVSDYSVPPHPGVVENIQAHLNEEPPNMLQVGRLASTDVGLSALVLQHINSNDYKATSSLQHPYLDVEGAAQLIGPEATGALVNKASANAEGKGYSYARFERFWDTAADVALITEDIAKRLFDTMPKETYLLGLLHDVGIPTMMHGLPDYRDFLREHGHLTGADIVSAEDGVFGVNHLMVGARLVESWGMPPVVSKAILHHCSIEPIAEFGDGDEFMSRVHWMNSLVYLAEEVEHAFRSVERERQYINNWAPVPEVVMRNLSLDEASMLELCDQALEDIEVLLQTYER